MCLAKPGPRCTPHAKAYLDSAKEALEEAKESGIAEDIAIAQQTFAKARWDYLTTEGGIEMLDRAHKKAVAEGDAARAMKFAQDRDKARAAHDEKLALYKSTQSAQSSASKPKPAMIKPGGFATTPPPAFFINKINTITSQKPKTAPRFDGTPTSTDGYKVNVKPHAFDQIKLKGFDVKQLCKAWAQPERIYPSKSHPGQHRITGEGICMVGEFNGNTFHIITIFEDGVVTAPRADQLNTPEGRAFAERYARLGDGARTGTTAHY